MPPKDPIRTARIEEAAALEEAVTALDAPEIDEPVFDRGEEHLPEDLAESLPTDDENNLLPGNDPMDDDPVDNGAEEGNDPDVLRRRRLLGDPMPD